MYIYKNELLNLFGLVWSFVLFWNMEDNYYSYIFKSKQLTFPTELFRLSLREGFKNKLDFLGDKSPIRGGR